MENDFNLNFDSSCSAKGKSVIEITEIIHIVIKIYPTTCLVSEFSS